MQSLLPSFLRSFRSDRRGTLLNDILAFQSPSQNIIAETNKFEAPARENITLSDTVYRQLCQWVTRQNGSSIRYINRFAVPLTAITDSDLSYKISDSSPGDSNVVFTDEAGDWRAGSICQIFKHTRMQEGDRVTETFLVINEYLPLSPSHSRGDPYRKFPIAGGRLFYSQFTSLPIILTIADVKCHAVVTSRSLPGTSIECVHVLPLDKVRNYGSCIRVTKDTLLVVKRASSNVWRSRKECFCTR